MHLRFASLIAAIALATLTTASSQTAIAQSAKSSSSAPKSLAVASSQLSPQAQVVQKLYSDFACEAASSAPGCTPEQLLVDQSQSTLERYFDASLTRQWMADRKCVHTTHGVCNLGFSPIWDSQDAQGTVVKVRQSPADSIVYADLVHPYYKEVRTLKYTLVRAPAGWRIHDIAREGEWSLQTLLASKP